MTYYVTVLLLIAALVVFSLLRGRRQRSVDRASRAAREAVEARMKDQGGK